MIQWERLKQYSLLADQTVQPLNLGDSVLNFSDVEEQVSGVTWVMVSRDVNLLHELVLTPKTKQQVELLQCKRQLMQK